jgi:predicted HTH transcriptional regulator
MYQEMASADQPPPEFEDRGSSVRVTLRRAPVAARSEPDPEVEPSQRVIHIPGNLAQTLNSRQVAALQFLRAHDRITTTDLMEIFPGISDRTASVDLMGLVTLRLLHRVGRTRGTYYHAAGAEYRLPHEV